MGQATVDLPDLPDVPACPVPNADELLSQLAGEEIDRLLAESEGVSASKGASAQTEVLSAPIPTTTTKDPIEQQLDALFEQLKSHHPQPPGSTEAVNLASPGEKDGSSGVTAQEVQSEPAVQAQLDELFRELVDPHHRTDPRPFDAEPAGQGIESSSPASTLAPEHAQPQGDPSHESSEQASSFVGSPTQASQTVTAVLGELASAEIDDGTDRSALMNDTPQPKVEGSALLDEPIEGAPLPLLLRPLEWINRPFEGLPETLRQDLGKVAIVTTLNSLAVLIYVVFFRN